MIFKTEYAANQFENCHEMIREIAADLDSFVYDCGEEFIITETRTTRAIDEKLNRRSATHREGRAIDIATNHMDLFTVSEVITYAKRKYGHLGAIKDGKPRLIVYGDDRHKNHIHLQINRKFAV
jgi:hypothetical protein